MSATTLKTTLQFIATTVETLDPTFAPGATLPKITHADFNVKEVLDGSSAAPVSILHEKTYGDASGTIDLTALPTTEGTQSCSGKRLQVLRINNRSTSHVFSLVVGASTGYVIGGAAINVKPGGCVMIYFADQLTDIDGTHKHLDYTFDAADEADVTLILG